ncbi:MAG: hypothetical protein AAGU27_06525, partial [Dehalobacterium sp.]
GTEKSYQEASRCYKIAVRAKLKGINFAELFKQVEDKIDQEMMYHQAMRMMKTPSFQQAIDTLIKLADEGYADAQFEVGKM